MKKIVSCLLAFTLLLGTTSAMAAKKDKGAGTHYTMKETGVVLQDAADRNIAPQDGVLDVNPVIEGESSVTGLPLENEDRYMPILCQISNPENKKPPFAGIGRRAPWGGQNADIVYEGLLYRSGQTRLTFLFSDAFAGGAQISAGPVRSARYGHVKLREEWQGGLTFFGGPKVDSDTPENVNNIFALLHELGADEKGVALNGQYPDYEQYFEKALFEGKTSDSSPDRMNADLTGLRSTIPAGTVAEKHPFLFADISPYLNENYDLAYAINLDWGHKKYISHFYYDEESNLYQRYCGNEPYMTFEDSNRYEDSKTAMAFSNVIVQRIGYTYAGGNKTHTQMNSVGKGNADIFIGGRYIPGYWVRESIDSPTVFLDDQGNEIQLSRGKTFIANFPPESLLTYDSELPQ